MTRIHLTRLLCLALMIVGTMGMKAQETANAMNKDNQEKLFAHLQPGDKAAVVAVHYGTSKTSALATLDHFNLRLAGAFPNADFRQAWAAAIVRRKHNEQVAAETETISNEEDTEFCLRKRKVTDLDHVLDELWRDGYTHVLIQPSFVIDGVEMNVLRKEVEQHEAHFAEIRIGQPLLATEQDYRTLITMLTKTFTDGKPLLLAAHGSSIDCMNGAYTMLDYLLHENAKSRQKCYTATVSGFPTLTHAIAQVKEDKVKRITIVPLLFAFGVHAYEDLAGTWTKELQQYGINATLYPHALGDNEDILDLYIGHAKQAEEKRILTPMELKQRYNGL